MFAFRPFLLATTLVVASQSVFAAIPATLYKSPTCGCCEAYVDYLQKNGFAVTAINQNDVAPIKQQLGVTPGMGSCHTTKIAGYVIEGHVPVAAIKRLLKEKPHIIGLSAPGMPQHAPGMGVEQPGSLPVYVMNAEQKTGILYGRF